ncbi:hypothetical protein EO763_23460 (plasmid) [Pectobacterium odoriferum]|uniref:hypothetical protein n=1 Tax=Pectobacterium odoriferum TaxID=78398 RepID=UPI001373EFB1|nr:hypothetical protein [Pectobacterium odoriferum]QHP82849.1 hypothetical protein EO763_23460 [Pectobacterium odoriferum]
MSNSTGKSLLAWMLVPLVVYGSLMAYWAIKIVAEEWPNESGEYLTYVLACIGLLLIMAYRIHNGHDEGKILLLSIVLPGLVTFISVLVKNYLMWGYLSIDLGFEFILATTFIPPLSVMLFKAIS